MLEFHPVADIFPLMSPEDLDELAKDIKDNGLREPVVIHDGKIIDGRNRARACEKAGVEPDIVTFPGGIDPLAYVVGMNILRRHLDASQRAMVGARLANMKVGRPKKASKDAITQNQAASRYGVGQATIDRAARVLAKGTKSLIMAVEAGKIAVGLAAQLAEQDEATQAAAVADPDRAVYILKKQTRAEHEASLTTKIKALPTKRYGVILADPEWRFIPWSEETGNDRAAANHYATSSLEQIKSRDVPSIAAADCVLALWATSPFLAKALEVMEAWGFSYRSHCIWLKNKPATGYWFRVDHELLLIGVKGQVPAPAPGTQWNSTFDADVGEHSEKPLEAYQLLEEYFPTLPKIELNARKSRKGWDAWGAEAPLDLGAVAAQ